VPTLCCTSQEAAAWLKRHGIAILTAQLQDSELYYDTDMTRPTALVMGTEDKGLSPFWREQADAHIRIPMAGAMDSLNVSISAAILCFEAVRQRAAR
jgi:TrmH family RNA methyltransferase